MCIRVTFAVEWLSHVTQKVGMVHVRKCGVTHQYAIAFVLTLNQFFSIHRMVRVTNRFHLRNYFHLSAVGWHGFQICPHCTTGHLDNHTGIHF